MIKYFAEKNMKSIIYGYLFAVFTVMMWSLNLIYAKFYQEFYSHRKFLFIDGQSDFLSCFR